jgi:hypothetical protein
MRKRKVTEYLKKSEAFMLDVFAVLNRRLEDNRFKKKPFPHLQFEPLMAEQSLLFEQMKRRQ